MTYKFPITNQPDRHQALAIESQQFAQVYAERAREFLAHGRLELAGIYQEAAALVSEDALWNLIKLVRGHHENKSTAALQCVLT